MGGSAALRLVHAAGLDGLVRRGSEHAFDELGSQRLLPVLPELRALLPGGGLRRGTTVGIATHPPPVHDGHAGAPAPAATSLLLALIAEASRAGSWCAVVGLPTLGAAAADELGIGLDRLALVPHPGPDWPGVVAALLDGFDIVVVAVPGPAWSGLTSAGSEATGARREGRAPQGPGTRASGASANAIASRLAARARQRGGVLVPYGPWPSTELTLSATDPVWHGVGAGRGRLRGRRLSIVARGRGAATVPRVASLWLPRPIGMELETPAELATVHPLRRAERATA
jgi:hypothetical protein